MQRIIFHIPNQIDEQLASGSHIRPLKMLAAFKEIGYHVDVIMGYVKDRRKQIQAIKTNIKNGIKYDFLYSESSTMPTALTEKHHMPIAPLLDFRFFRFCKKHNIKIGLFYRDIHWQFEQYKTNGVDLKKTIAKFFYRLDLRYYRQVVHTLYLPSTAMYQHIPFSFSGTIKALPPAVSKETIQQSQASHTTDLPSNISCIYVGGLGTLYDLQLFAQVVGKRNIPFHLCTRQNEWHQQKERYQPLPHTTKVWHVKGEELPAIYRNALIAVLFVKPTIYWNFVMAVKLFEYMAYKKPIIAVKGTAVGHFVADNDIGWTIEYTQEALATVLDHIEQHPEIIAEKIKNIEKIIPHHTWTARARQVQKDLAL